MPLCATAAAVLVEFIELIARLAIAAPDDYNLQVLLGAFVSHSSAVLPTPPLCCDDEWLLLSISRDLPTGICLGYLS